MIRGTLLQRAQEAAQGAGAILRSRYGRLRREHARLKQGGRRDLVTEADVDAERFLVERVPETDDILGEEGSRRETGAARKWILDPLDGTVNFLHGIPFWCVSVGVVEDGVPVAAVVHAPALGQTFTAAAGEGCLLNGERVQVSATSEIEDAVLASGFAYRRDELQDNNLDNWATLSLAAAGLRRMGAAALDLAYVACGRLDGFWELHLNAWDVAAGVLLVREAGGRVTDFRGAEDLDKILYGRHIVASNGPLHEPIRSRLAPLKDL